MNYIALRMLMGERAKYLGLIFAIAFSTFLLENQTSIFAGILKRTASQVLDVTDAEVWVMDPRTEYFEQTRALKETDLFRVRGVPGVRYAGCGFSRARRSPARRTARFRNRSCSDSTMLRSPARGVKCCSARGRGCASRTPRSSTKPATSSFSRSNRWSWDAQWS
jgi:putative ABC transport system permease protein